MTVDRADVSRRDPDLPRLDRVVTPRWLRERRREQATHGAHLARWGSARIRRLEEAIASNVLLLPTMGMLRLCGQLKTRAVRAGHPLGHPIHANDLWIAACAGYYGVPLLTRNRRHFAGMPGVEVRSAPEG